MASNGQQSSQSSMDVLHDPSRNGGENENVNDSNPAEVEDNSTTSASEPAKRCANCNKLEEDPEEKPLKPCNKCHSVLYCSRDCQKTDFKKHKKTCASAAQIHAQTSGPSRMQVTRAPPKHASGPRGLQKWNFDT